MTSWDAFGQAVSDWYRRREANWAQGLPAGVLGFPLGASEGVRRFITACQQADPEED